MTLKFFCRVLLFMIFLLLTNNSNSINFNNFLAKILTLLENWRKLERKLLKTQAKTQNSSKKLKVQEDFPTPEVPSDVIKKACCISTFFYNSTWHEYRAARLYEFDEILTFLVNCRVKSASFFRHFEKNSRTKKLKTQEKNSITQGKNSRSRQIFAE